MNREELFYEMIFKRKSFHIFKDIQTISESELVAIEEVYQTFQPLVNDIRTEIKIVPAEETTCKRGQEYCILLYSEKKDNYLQNIGYIGEQLDLNLTSLNIGALWYGFGKVEEKQYNGLDFIIMLAIAKMPKDKFRKDMFKSKRKPLEEVWQCEHYPEIGNIARFSPSACNTQPWIVEETEGKLTVYRYEKPGKRGIMPADKVTYYNRIDLGIFLLFLELCLSHEQVQFERILLCDAGVDEAEKTPVAEYRMMQDEKGV